MISLRKLAVLATPGRARITLLMSRLPPGLRMISAEPIVRTDNGLSWVRVKGLRVISTSLSSVAEGSSAISSSTGRAVPTCTSVITRRW